MDRNLSACIILAAAVVWESATDWTLLGYRIGPGEGAGGRVTALGQAGLTPAGIADHCDTDAGGDNHTDGDLP